MVAHHGTAISLWNENLVYANNFTGNGVGIRLNGASGNVFYGNNFVDNQLSDVDLNSDVSPANAWDNGTYGNYWSNYKSAYPDAIARALVLITASVLVYFKKRKR